jgi:reverse gyrase
MASITLSHSIEDIKAKWKEFEKFMEFIESEAKSEQVSLNKIYAKKILYNVKH